MAAVLAIEGAEAVTEGTEVAESGQAQSAFKMDSEENAQSQGVDFSSLGKIAGETVGLVVKILDFVRSERKTKEEDEERKKQRYSAGIVYSPEENRELLIRQGKIPAYYSTSNIRGLLNDNLLPRGWSTEVAVNQGFFNEIRAGEFRAKNKKAAEDILAQYDTRRKIRQQAATVEALDRRLRLNRALQSLKIT